jgi:hypothetical protein
MNPYDIAKLCDGAYDAPEVEAISRHLGPDGTPRPPADDGDTLTLFIAQEVASVFDPAATDAQNLKAAVDAMETAAFQLGDVASRLGAEAAALRKAVKEDRS